MRRVAVTGAAGLIGQKLLGHLAADPEIEEVLALDLRPPEPIPEKVRFLRHDVREPMGGVFREHVVDAAVHLAFLVDPSYDRERERTINVGGTERFFEACDEAGVQTALLASSATVYGAWPDNPPLIPEDHPLRGKPGFPYVEDKLELEAMAARYASGHPQCRVLLIRPTVVMGPRMDNYLSRFFLRPVAFRIAGANPPVPAVHEDDVAEATWKILKEAPAGPYNLNSGGGVPLLQALAMMGRRAIPLPPALLKALAGMAWTLRLRALSEVPPAMTDYIRWPWTADGTKVERETSFRYRFTARATMESFIATQNGDGR